MKFQLPNFQIMSPKSTIHFGSPGRNWNYFLRFIWKLKINRTFHLSAGYGPIGNNCWGLIINGECTYIHRSWLFLTSIHYNIIHRYFANSSNSLKSPESHTFSRFFFVFWMNVRMYRCMGEIANSRMTRGSRVLSVRLDCSSNASQCFSFIAMHPNNDRRAR